MKVFNNEIKAFIETPDVNKDNVDILLGIHVMEGECEQCKEPMIGIQIGFLFFTITITITKTYR